jgi:hypothetical protein
MELEEAAPHMRPAEREADGCVGAISGQSFESRVTINLKHAFEGREMFSGMRALPILGINVGRRRVRRTAPWPVIDRVTPQRPVLVRPRPGSSTGKVVSSANSFVEDSTVLTSRS